MKVVSYLHDKRIDSMNYLVEMSIEEYLLIVKDIMHKNEFQRRRVKSSTTVYSLLKSDLDQGCIIPPIVLALTSDIGDLAPEVDGFQDFVSANKDHLIILDGLQRTNTIVDLVSETTSKNDEEGLVRINSHTIRAEFYIGLNRLGILYRMLTLNTGQSPMSLRQQIEILYFDYSQTNIDGIELFREAEDRRVINLNQYSFRDIIEGFNSYLERNELPIDRADLLENIKSLEKLSKENQKVDLFMSYLKSWHAFISKIDEIGNGIDLSEDFIKDELKASPFGNNLIQVFKKPQAMSGFGAAIGKLKDFKLIENWLIVKESG